MGRRLLTTGLSTGKMGGRYLGEHTMSDEDVRLRLTRYKRGTSRIAGFKTPMVGYHVRCSCGFEQRHNESKADTMCRVVRPHLRDVHDLRGEAADEVIR